MVEIDGANVNDFIFMFTGFFVDKVNELLLLGRQQSALA